MIPLLLGMILNQAALASDLPLWSPSVLCDRFSQGNLSPADQEELLRRVRTRMAITVEMAETYRDVFELTGKIDELLRVTAPDLVPLLEQLTIIPGRSLLAKQVAALRGILLSLQTYHSTFRIEHGAPSPGDLNLIQSRLQKILQAEISMMMPEMRGVYEARDFIAKINKQALPEMTPVIEAMGIALDNIYKSRTAIAPEIDRLNELEKTWRVLMNKYFVDLPPYLKGKDFFSFLNSMSQEASGDIRTLLESGINLWTRYLAFEARGIISQDFTGDMTFWYETYAPLFPKVESHLSALIKATEEKVLAQALISTQRPR